MSYLYAFLGFAALVVLHEFGHFLAAKAVGMKVERFSLFFGPMLVKRRIGETVYGVGVIPLGGYVKITGMSPEEVFESPSDEARAYTNMPVWKRVVVITAGPLVNLLIAFVLLAGVFATQSQHRWVKGGQTITAVAAGSPAAPVLRPGDRIVSVGGATTQAAIRRAVDRSSCPGAQTDGCIASPAVLIRVRRDGRLLRFDLHPRYNSRAGRPLIGFSYSAGHPGPVVKLGLLSSAGWSARQMWYDTTHTVSALARIFQPKERRQLHTIVAVYAITQQQLNRSTASGLWIIGSFSLALAVFNLFPFLPLDGGHIFWAIAEKVRGRKITLRTMERASFVGLALMVLLVGVGLSNDIPSLLHGGFHVR